MPWVAISWYTPFKMTQMKRISENMWRSSILLMFRLGFFPLQSLALIESCPKRGHEEGLCRNSITVCGTQTSMNKRTKHNDLKSMGSWWREVIQPCAGYPLGWICQVSALPGFHLNMATKEQNWLRALHELRRFVPIGVASRVLGNWVPCDWPVRTFKGLLDSTKLIGWSIALWIEGATCDNFLGLHGKPGLYKSISSAWDRDRACWNSGSHWLSMSGASVGIAKNSNCHSRKQVHRGICSKDLDAQRNYSI